MQIIQSLVLSGEIVWDADDEYMILKRVNFDCELILNNCTGICIIVLCLAVTHNFTIISVDKYIIKTQRLKSFVHFFNYNNIEDVNLPLESFVIIIIVSAFYLKGEKARLLLLLNCFFFLAN